MNQNDYFHAPGRVGCTADADLMAELNARRLPGETIDALVRRLLWLGIEREALRGR